MKLTRIPSHYIAAVRALLDELRKDLASGIIMPRAEALYHELERLTRELERAE